MLAVVVSALVAGCGAEGDGPRTARCKNADCSEAISIVRARRDFVNDVTGFAFSVMDTFAVHSKDGAEWEGKVRFCAQSPQQVFVVCG